ncbi:MAG: hypothetical protein AB1730_04735 [Myxococcota bacterium]
MFGEDEALTCIQPVTLLGADGESLCLAFTTSKSFVGTGVYLKDEGDVLEATSQKDLYHPMPAPEELKAFRAQGWCRTRRPRTRCRSSRTCSGARCGSSSPG